MSRKSPGIRYLFAPNSLGIKLLSRTLIILATLLALIGIFQYIFMQGVIYKNKAASIQSQIRSLPPKILLGNGTLSDERPLPDKGPVPDNGDKHSPFFFERGTNFAFIDTKGNYSILFNGPGNISPPKLDKKEYLTALNQKHRLNYKIINSGGSQQLLVLEPVMAGPDNVVGLVQGSTLTGPLKDLLVRQLITFLILALLALLFGLLGYIPVLKKTLLPLYSMVDTSEQIDAGNLDRRFPASQGQLEIDRLAESFNAMLERLEASFKAERETKEQMRRFVADASHELRTPLTSIHGFLEVLLRGAANDPDQLNKSLKSMHSESERLNKLVRDLLLLAKLDRTTHPELKEGLLDTLIRDMEPQLRILAGNRSLNLQIESNMKCIFDPDKIKQVVLNIFQNAVQYTDSEEGQIEVSLCHKNNGVLLAVRDNGPGISEIHLPHVFERFYRSDSSRTRKYGGSGLGLAISKSILEASGGTISVVSQSGRGCTFQVWLPALP